MIILRDKLFSQRKSKDEEESEDTKYSNKLSKLGKKVAAAGGIALHKHRKKKKEENKKKEDKKD